MALVDGARPPRSRRLRARNALRPAGCAAQRSTAMCATDLLLRNSNLPLIALDLADDPTRELRPYPPRRGSACSASPGEQAVLLVFTPWPMVASAHTRLLLHHPLTLRLAGCAGRRPDRRPRSRKGAPAQRNRRRSAGGPRRLMHAMFAAILLPSFHLPRPPLRLEPELHRQAGGVARRRGTHRRHRVGNHGGGPRRGSAGRFHRQPGAPRCPTLQLRRRLSQQEEAAAEVLRQTLGFFPVARAHRAGLVHARFARPRRNQSSRLGPHPHAAPRACSSSLPASAWRPIPISRASPPAGPGPVCS